MARFYSNENFPKPVVIHLRTLGHDVLTTLDAGKSDQEIPDDEVLDFAISQERILVTLNRRDFIQLHRQTQTHFGIIVCTFDSDFKGQAERIHAFIENDPDMSGKLVRINRPG